MVNSWRLFHKIDSCPLFCHLFKKHTWFFPFLLHILTHKQISLLGLIFPLEVADWWIPQVKIWWLAFLFSILHSWTLYFMDSNCVTLLLCVILFGNFPRNFFDPSPTPVEYYFIESSNMAIHTLCFNFSEEEWQYCSWILPFQVFILYFCWRQWPKKLYTEHYVPKYDYSSGPSYIFTQQIWPIFISKFQFLFIFADSFMCEH